MATQSINKINYAGVTYKFVDDDCAADVLVLGQKVDRLYDSNNTKIQEETARAKAAEDAILATQVSKEAGKGLSTNDFTNYYKGWIDNPPVFAKETETDLAKNGVVPGPAKEIEGMYLDSEGNWTKPHDTTYNNATQTVSGLMSFTDKIKLDDMDGNDEASMGFNLTIGENTISQEYTSGKTNVYTFNEDGSITQTITTSYGKVINLKTTFGDGTITREVIS